jgi:hypothetical protein
VPITPFLAGAVFDPEAIAIMDAVYTEVCGRLALTGKSDAATRMVAEKIIELASTGNYDESTLRTAAFRAFGLRE